ncbi:MAG TPA: prepilin-type N-terminal cleavage/methylation domain-containing protein [Gemmatimonadales bacterium]|nr:prepilin-type N-terminal cleavage/methylation domain-containing protein [Gemmatimonadales bacterium]
MSAARRGFTFIEILVVMIVIGVLAGLAYARLQSQKEKAIVAGMLSDLRAIAEEQEGHYFQNRTYTSDLLALNARLSPGDTMVIVEATSVGWSGRIYNPRSPKQCYILVGRAVPVGSATQDGMINCS